MYLYSLVVEILSWLSGGYSIGSPVNVTWLTRYIDGWKYMVIDRELPDSRVENITIIDSQLQVTFILLQNVFLLENCLSSVLDLILNLYFKNDWFSFYIYLIWVVNENDFNHNWFFVLLVQVSKIISVSMWIYFSIFFRL